MIGEENVRSVDTYVPILIAIMASVFLGGYLLENLGVNYVSDGGSALLKIHLYTYVIFAMFAILAMKFGPAWFCERLGSFNKTWWIAIFSLSFVIIYGYFRHGTSGMAYIINTFLAPLLFIPLLSSLDDLQKDKVIKLISYLILLNSVIAIFEYLTSSRVVDIDFQEFSFFRSSALLTHPLNNALITASLGLLIFKRTLLPGFLYILITLLGLFAFGGRAALIIFSCMFFLYCIPSGWKFITTGIRGDKRKIALFMFLGYFALVFFVFIIVGSGITERIMSKLYIDGSASARIDVFFLFDQLTASEWVFGASHRLLESIELYIGISVIENYFIGWIFTFGLMGTIPLSICVFLTLYYFAKNGDIASRLAVVTFMIVGLTNNSLTTKTPVLLLLFSVLYLISVRKTQANNY
jgi:hypothetical protein